MGSVRHLIDDPVLDKIRKASEGTPWEGQLWLVGGAVRDSLLGTEERMDFDIVLEGDALAAAALISEKLAVAPPVTYARFGTAMVQIDGVEIEFAQARTESYAAESRKPSVSPATLRDDAFRRDFTVNALMVNLHSGKLWDPLGTGLPDLTAKVLRTPKDPRTTFSDDPLRMMRAVRFRWKLGFAYAAGLEDAIRDEAHRLEVVSLDRIREEFVKMLLGAHPDRALQDLLDLRLLEEFAPELAAMRGVNQGRWHDADVWDHTLRVVTNLRPPRSVTLVLAALLHDVAKPRTRCLDAKGEVRFFGHEVMGAAMAEEMLRRLKFANHDIEPVVLLVRNHMRLGSFTNFTDAAARRLIRDLGDQLGNLLDLVEADAAALRPGVRVLDLQPVRRRIEAIAVETPAHRLESPLDGEAIMRITGLGPGREVGALKRRLTDEVVEGRLAPGDVEAAEAWLRTQTG